MSRAVQTVKINPPMRGPGGTFLHWLAFYDDERESGARGWGTTAREATNDLQSAAARPVSGAHGWIPAPAKGESDDNPRATKSPARRKKVDRGARHKNRARA